MIGQVESKPDNEDEELEEDEDLEEDEEDDNEVPNQKLFDWHAAGSFVYKS